MATEIFKAFHGSTPIYIRDLFEEKDKIYNLNLLNGIRLESQWLQSAFMHSENNGDIFWRNSYKLYNKMQTVTIVIQDIKSILQLFLIGNVVKIVSNESNSNY